MIDLDIRYPGALDILPVTTTVSINVGQNINALRDAILNLETVLGLDVNIGLFTPNPEDATVADRLNRLERGIAERNLVFRELNVSDALSVILNINNEPVVRIGRGVANSIAPVTILGPLTILAPAVVNPETYIQTPVRLDVTTFNPNMSAKSMIKGKSNTDEPLLIIQDTNSATFVSDSTKYALVVQGNVKVTGVLTAEYSIDHSKLLNIETVPTDATRGQTRHVTQGDYHTHRKGRYDTAKSKWVVDSSANTSDFGIIQHKDLEGIGTLPTHGNDFTPLPGVAYHVTGGDLHSHKSGDGAQIDHNDLKNINPKFSAHVTGGDAHDHTNGRGAQISHQNLSDIGTNGPDDIHVPLGGNHFHQMDENGNPIGDGAQINHAHLSNIDTLGAAAVHVTKGDAHAHTSSGDGGKINHIDLLNVGTLSHDEIDARISRFRVSQAGTASFASSGPSYNEVTVSHLLGTDQFNVAWSLSALNGAPPSNPFDVGVIYVTDKSTTTFKIKRLFSSSSVIRMYDSDDVPASSLATVIPHGLGTVPSSLELLHEVSTRWEFLDPNSYLKADATNIFTNLTLLGSDTVRILATAVSSSAALQPGPAVKAQATTALVNPNSNLLFIAKTPGATGNSISIQYEENSSIVTNPFIVATTTSIVVFFTGSVTANAVRLAILGDFTARTIVDVLNATGSDGSGSIDDVSQFFLTDGADTSGTSPLSIEWIAVSKTS